MKRINIKRFLPILILILALFCCACRRRAPDDSYMIDLSAERDVEIIKTISYWNNGDLDKFRLFEQFIADKFSDTFNSEVPNVEPVKNDDKESAIKAADTILKQYFGDRYIDAGNGKAKVEFKQYSRGKLCYYNCGDAYVVFERTSGEFRGCFDLRIQTYLHPKSKLNPWVITMEVDLYKQSAEHLCTLQELDLRSFTHSTSFSRIPVYDAQTAFEAAKKLSGSTKGVNKEFAVYFSPNSNAWIVCNKYWIVAFGSDNAILFSVGGKN